MNDLSSVSELVPHDGNMCFLSSVEAFDEKSLHAKARIESTNPFLVEDTISSWIGIEYMAQAIAAWAGSRAKNRGEPAKVGLLLGTRHYHVDSPPFRLHCELDIYVNKIIESENNLAVFECRIEYEEGLIAANINVFMPDNIETVLPVPNNE